jgi:hypothetical protein
MPWDNLIFPCPNTEIPDGIVSYCCGPDPTSCCSSKQYFSIPYVMNTAVSIWRPISTPTFLSTTGTAQLTAPLPSTIQTTSSTTSTTLAPSHTQGITSDKSLAIGLGVGITLGLLLISAITLLGWQLRRFNSRHASNTQQEVSQGPSQLPVHQSELDASLSIRVVS